MAISLAHRHGVVPVALGVCGAFLVLNALAILFGAALYAAVPESILLLFASALFLVFAFVTWRAAGEPDAAPVDTESAGGGAAAASFVLIFVAEFGDKTQLVLIALAASTGDAVAVFVGGTAALWAVSLLGIVVGARLLRHVPRAWVHRVAACLFLVFACLATVRAVS